MAERPIQRISPLDLRRNVAVGVPFPLGGTPIFSSTFSTQDQALSNLKCLLLTRKGERPFQPLFGTDLPSFLFEQITDKLLNSLRDTIAEDIKFWLPYIKMKDIIVTKKEVVNLIKDYKNDSIVLHPQRDDIEETFFPKIHHPSY